MVREFKEETGKETTPQQWRVFGELEGDDFKVFLFVTSGEINGVRTAEDEPVSVWLVDDMDRRADVVENLPWLVYLAIDAARDGRPGYVHVQYH